MRSLGTEIANATAAAKISGIYFFKLALDSGNVCWHTGFGDYVVGADTYTGLGSITSIGSIKEESGVKASGLTVGISGINSEVVSLFLSEPYINRKAYVYFVPLTEGDQPVISTPYLLFRGTIDDVSGTQGKTASFSITLKSRFADWERPVKSLYTDVEQQRLHPGDKGLEYIGQLSQKKIIWPRAAFLPDPRD